MAKPMIAKFDFSLQLNDLIDDHLAILGILAGVRKGNEALSQRRPAHLAICSAKLALSSSPFGTLLPQPRTDQVTVGCIYTKGSRKTYASQSTLELLLTSKSSFREANASIEM